MLNASVGMQRVIARLRPDQSRRSVAVDIIRRQNVFLAATLRRVGSLFVLFAAAAGSVARPWRSGHRPVAAPLPRHITIRSGSSALAPRSISVGPARAVISSDTTDARHGNLHQPTLAPRSAQAANGRPVSPAVITAPVVGQGRLIGRSFIARIGAERAVPAAAIAIVLVATALSSAPSLGSSGPVGGPTGDGPGARLSVGGVAGAVGGPGTAAAGGVDGTVDQSGPDGGLAAVGDGTTPTTDQANYDASLVDSGTLLKPVAVDTSVSDGSGLMRSYRVRSGDSLTGIARKFGVSMMTVWWANHLSHKNDLHVGQTLTIPPVSGVVITVGSSDTLESLAAKYAVDAATIVDANALEDPNLVIGQTLTVPGALGAEIATPTAAPTRTPTRSTGSRSTTSSHTSRPVSAPPAYSGGKLAWPVAGGYISQYFHYGHYALDIAADRGTAAKAAAAGVVTFAGWKSNGGGYQVWISHGSGLYTTYNHMSSVSVGRGESVSRGQMVGRVGSTGNATGPHLHFEVWRGAVWDGGTRVNPLLYL